MKSSEAKLANSSIITENGLPIRALKFLSSQKKDLLDFFECKWGWSAVKFS
jgi:hypothetical protein